MTEQVKEDTTVSRLLVALLVSYFYFIANCLNKDSWGLEVPDGHVFMVCGQRDNSLRASGQAVAAVWMLHTWPASPVHSSCIQLVVHLCQG